MIIIEERKSVKLPGTSSLFINTPYNAEIVKNIKTICSNYHYNKKTNEWEIPVTFLTPIFDFLSFLDDIRLIILKTNKNAVEGKFKPLNYKLKPFDYQLEGIEFGLRNNKWLLLDEPGLGKSAQIIHIAEELREQRGLEHCLIICGVNTLKANWKKEIAKHSYLDCTILGETLNAKGNSKYVSVLERAKQLEEKIDEFFIITNIETFRSEEVVKAFKNSKNKIDMIAVDEIHKCKNPTSIQGANLLKLNNINYKIAATGTLIMNNPLDAYVPLAWTENNATSFTAFKSFYCNYDTRIRGRILSFKNLEILKDQINNCSLRRKKVDVLKDLPPKTIIHELLDMNDTHRKFYEDICSGIKGDVDKVKLNHKYVLSLVTRLRQASTCPSILTTNETIKSSKIDRAIDLIEQIVSNGDKVVVFSSYKESVYNLAREIPEYEPLVMTGDTKDYEISKNIDIFQNDKEHPVIIATWQKMGTGITLTAASYCIFIDCGWTASQNQQAEDRIYRIGASKNVFIYYLWCKNTIDEKVKDIVSRKQMISDFVVDDELDENSYNELRKFIEDM